MFTASSSRASSARAAVVERLRRVLFSPQRLLTAGTLACVLACGGFAAAQGTVINAGQTEFSNTAQAPWILNGGTLIFTGSNFFSPPHVSSTHIYDKTLQWGTEGGTLNFEQYYTELELDTTDPANTCIKTYASIPEGSDASEYQLFYCAYALDENHQPTGNLLPIANVGSLVYQSDYNAKSPEDQALYAPIYVRITNKNLHGSDANLDQGNYLPQNNVSMIFASSVLGLAQDTTLTKTGAGSITLRLSNDSYQIIKDANGELDHITNSADAKHIFENITVNGGTLRVDTLAYDSDTDECYLVSSSSSDFTSTFNGDILIDDKNPGSGTRAQLTVLGNATLNGNVTNRNGDIIFNDSVTINGQYVSKSKDRTSWQDKKETVGADIFLNDTVINNNFIVEDAGFGARNEDKADVTLNSNSVAWILGDSAWTDSANKINENGQVCWKNGDATTLTVNTGGWRGGLNTTAKNVDNISQITVNDGGVIRFRNYKSFKEDENGNYVIGDDGNPIYDPNYTIDVEDGRVYADWYDLVVGNVESRDGFNTTDELGNVTELYRDATYEAITKQVNDRTKLGDWKDDLFSSPLSGDGTIEIAALAYKKGVNKLEGANFFVGFTGDQSQFTGDTDVQFGSLVLLSSSYNDQQYIESGYAESEEYAQYQAWQIAHEKWEANGEIGDEPAKPETPIWDKLSRDMVKQVYGSAAKEGTFTVRGQSTRWLLEQDTETIGTNGRVGFWRNTFNGDLNPGDDAYQKSLASAPILNADTIKFEGSQLYNSDKGEWYYDHAANDLGAQIVFNTAFEFENSQYDGMNEQELQKLGLVRDTNNAGSFFDIRSDRTLATLNANTIAFSESNYVWYDGISQLDESAKLTIDLNADTIKVYTNDVVKDANGVDQKDDDGYYYLTDATHANTDALKGVFAKPLVNANVTGQAGDYAVTVNAINVADFAKNEKMTQAEQDYAAKFDEARLRSDANVRFNDALYNENDGNKVRQTIHNLSLLGHQMLNQHSHFGNPSSAFFGGAAISGEAKRGQQARNDEPLPNPSAINTQEQEYNPTRGVWASFTHTNVDGAAYQDSGITMHGYDLERSGVIGGIKRQYDATLSGGLFFGLTMPEMYSKANLENSSSAYVRTQMEMTDFQFAGHLEKIIADNWELCLFVGGGHQSMDWERNVNLDKFNTTYKADGTGNTLTGTAYLAYRVDMNDRWTIRPTVGIDSEHSWLYNFEETGGALGSLSQVGYNNQMLAQRYRYDDTYYNRNLARVGFTTAFDGAQGWAGLNGRVFYSTQLGGKPAPLLSYNTVGDVNNANYVDLRFEDMNSHVMGSDAFSVGGGGYMHLNKTKTLTANGDVNAIWYKNASTLNVTGGVSYRF